MKKIKKAFPRKADKLGSIKLISALLVSTTNAIITIKQSPVTKEQETTLRT